MTPKMRLLLKALAYDIGQRAAAVRLVAHEASRYGADTDVHRLSGKADGLLMGRDIVLELARDGEGEEE